MRLTPKKVSDWHARIERSRKAIDRVHAEVKADRMKAKGGDLSALDDLAPLLAVAGVSAVQAEAKLVGLTDRAVRVHGHGGAA
jgi:hypothetical protein